MSDSKLTASSPDLIASYVLDGKGGAKRLNDWHEISQWNSEQGLLWIHTDCEESEVEHHLYDLPDLSKLAVDALLLNETRPRSDVVDNGLLVVLRGVNTNPGADPDDMVALRIWLEPNRIITSRRRRLKSMETIRLQLEANTGPKNLDDFFIRIVDDISLRISDVIETLDSNIEDVENDISNDSESLKSSRESLTSLRRESAMLRRYIAPQRDALERLHREANTVLSASCRMELREEGDRFRRYVEDLDLAREKILVSQEHLLTTLTEEQNKRMYVLSIVAAIFLPLGFVTGLLGMNVGGIPGEGKPDAFVYLMTGMVVVTVFLVSIFKWKKWL